MAEALINPSILVWARERAGLAVPEIAKKLNVKPEQLLQWEEGTKKPTFKQAQNFAQKTYIPFGYLYLEQTPEEKVPLPDCRTIGDHPINQYSPELQTTIHMALERQSWYREYCQHNDYQPLEWLGSANIHNFDNTLQITHALLNDGQARSKNFDTYYQQLRNRMETLGILIMRNSVVGNNTHRPLDHNEFRGFAISDLYAPLIFINMRDTPQAQVFTLLHEFAHLLLGESGVSDLAPNNPHGIEKFCNRIAAEFLVPSKEFIHLWESKEEPWTQNLAILAQHFHVSQWVIARRALEHNFIDQQQYWDYYRKILNHFNKTKSQQEGGPPFNRLVKMRYSNNLVDAVTSEALSGRLLLRDAAHLIGVRPENLKKFAKTELGM